MVCLEHCRYVVNQASYIIGFEDFFLKKKHVFISYEVDLSPEGGRKYHAFYSLFIFTATPHLAATVPPLATVYKYNGNKKK